MSKCPHTPRCGPNDYCEHNYIPKETVDHPDHYGGDTVYETIKVLEVWMPREEFIGFLRGNAIKYQSRLGRKGDAIEDAAKAAWYSNYLEKFLQRKPKCKSKYLTTAMSSISRVGDLVDSNLVMTK